MFGLVSLVGQWCYSWNIIFQLEGRKSDHEQPSPLQRDARRELDGSEMRDVIKTEKSEIKPVKKELHHTEPVVVSCKSLTNLFSSDNVCDPFQARTFICMNSC